MRVLLINKFYYLKGGAERAYFDTAHILAENGHSVAFFAMEHPENVETPWSRFFVSGVDYHASEAGLFSRARAALRILWNHEAVRKLNLLIDEFHPDVAHLHNIYHQLSPSIIWTLKKRGVRIVMTLHDYKLISPNYSLLVRGKVWEHGSGLRAILDQAVQDSYAKSLVCTLEQWLHRCLGTYQKVDAFLAPSHFLIEKFQAFGFSQPITHVVQPLRPFPLAPTNASGEYLLFIGRLSEEKGVVSLIEAMRELGPTYRLKIVGTGPDEATLRTLAVDLPQIEFLGYQTGAPLEEILSGAQALVLPSIWYENMPYVLLEALSHGKPVIASNMGGVPERIRSGKNGLLFKAGDASDLAEKIQALATLSAEALSQGAYESVSDARPEQYYQALMALYTTEQK